MNVIHVANRHGVQEQMKHNKHMRGTELCCTHVNGVVAGIGDVGDGACCVGRQEDLVINEGILLNGGIHVPTRYVTAHLQGGG